MRKGTLRLTELQRSCDPKTSFAVKVRVALRSHRYSLFNFSFLEFLYYWMAI